MDLQGEIAVLMASSRRRATASGAAKYRFPLMLVIAVLAASMTLAAVSGQVELRVAAHKPHGVSHHP